MIKTLDRKFPKILSNQIQHAFGMCRSAGIKPDDIAPLLDQYRRNRAKFIASIGITRNKPIEILSNPCNLIAYESSALLFALERLDDAFEALHKYLGLDGAEEYISKDVASKIISVKNSENGKKSRSQKSIKESIDEVVKYLIKRDYHASDNKKEIKRRAKDILTLERQDGTLMDLTDHYFEIARKLYVNQKKLI